MSKQKTSLSILDVGHGNSTVLVDECGVVVIDAGPRSALLEFLKQEGIDKLDVVLISHADRDHIEGLLALITSEEFDIGRVRLNSDALKGSELWDDLVYALNKGHLSGQIDFNPVLTINDSGTFDQGTVHIEILAPSLYLAAKGPGSVDRKSRPITSNSISAVIRLVTHRESLALIPGDMDDVGLENLIESGHDCTAPILVFPHHGGRPGSADMRTFARRLCEIVKPQTVIYSIGRGRYSNPQPEIVASVRETLPDVRIACTQLSERCAKHVPSTEITHLTSKFAHGRHMRRCCGGTFVVELDHTESSLLPHTKEHLTFIKLHAETPMCLRGLDELDPRNKS